MTENFHSDDSTPSSPVTTKSSDDDRQTESLTSSLSSANEIRPINQARKGFSIQPLSPQKSPPTSFGNQMNDSADKTSTASSMNEQVQHTAVSEMNTAATYKASSDIHPADEDNLSSALYRLPDKDFSFIVKNEMILVHKFVLAAQSKYFYQQFIDNYDNSIDTVYVEEFDKEAVELAVRACYDQYFDETTLENRITKQLIKFATTFNIRPVLELLPQSLSKTIISQDNVAELAIQSIETNDSDLFERCVAFVADCLTKHEVTPGIEDLPAGFHKAVVLFFASKN